MEDCFVSNGRICSMSCNLASDICLQVCVCAGKDTYFCCVFMKESLLQPLIYLLQ